MTRRIDANARKSVVDVVQSVVRVMRKSTGKDFGYIILPIAIPAGLTPEQALADNKRYAVVWEVLQALRAHDDRFNAEINKIAFNKSSKQVVAVTVPGPDRDEPSQPGDPQLPLTWGDELRTAIYARMVQKVGQRTYWDEWAKDIAEIADRHVTRIKAILDNPELDVVPLFDRFLAGLRANLNDAITRDNAIEMLAQHVITKPVFDALFEGYDFTERNPVSLVMQDMLDVLDEQGIDTEVETLDRFYASVATRARGIETAEGKQQIITQLYEKFFKNAFPKAAESLGIVYTPVEIVDFILRSVEHLLKEEFGASLNDEDVHVLDPFTGTGTFVGTGTHGCGLHSPVLSESGLGT